MSRDKGAETLTPLQNAIYLLKQSEAKLASWERARTEPIAIIGMSCRFPAAEHPEAYWRLLCDGVDAIREVPPTRWNVDEFYDADPAAPGKSCTRWGGFLDAVDGFDADFFGISPREAVRIDPQHRLLLEVSWEALENAGLAAERIADTATGVYVGAIVSDYALLQSRDLTDMDVFSGTGSSQAILANRLSYVLNLKGPSIALDTACSSSLVTVHLACQSLRRGETDLGLAGGVNLILSPEMTVALSKAHMMSPDGRCKAFDAAADGYVRGEGCGMLVLKRLSDARRDGDRVVAVIRGTAVNHDGRSNGLSAPNGPAQEAVLRAALADARLAPGDVGYVEAHGTGTRLGDPIEVEALRAVLCAGRSEDHPLLLGSVKTNIGHLESAAGIAGLIKAVLMLKHEQVPPHLHLNKVNPLLGIEHAPIRIPTEVTPWPRGERPRRAGISSFGFGGTNSHIIVEEAGSETSRPADADRGRHLISLSARSAEALSQVVERHAEFLAAHPSASLADLAFTGNTGRAHFNQRVAVVAESVQQARDRLEKLQAGEEPTGVHRGEIEHDSNPRIAFLFTGQGAQYARMGHALYRTQPTFRAALDECDELLRPHLDRPLLSLLESDEGGLLDQTGYTQPALFALEYALTRLWESWGIRPDAVMGHSVGEFTAACVAGVFGLEDGLRLIAQRARLMQSLPAGGRMAAVFAPDPTVAAALDPSKTAIAALNGPRNTVVSGEGDAVHRVLADLKAQGVKSKMLATSHAFHSHLMEPILEELRNAAASVACSAPRIDLISNLTAELADEHTYADPDYWPRHARSPVRFAESMQTLAERGCEIFLEIGPSPTLIGMGRHCVPDGERIWLPSLRQGRDDWQCLLDSVAELYVRGAPVDWAGYDRDYPRRKRSLPTYPFQRRRYWARSATVGSSPEAPLAARAGNAIHPLLGRRLHAAVADKVFEAQLTADRPATLADHVVQGAVVTPGAAYLEMALAASAAVHGHPWVIRNAAFLDPLVLAKTPKTVQTILTPEGAGAASFRVVSVSVDDADGEATFKTHAIGQLEPPPADTQEPIDLEQEQARYTGEPYDDRWRFDAQRKSGLEPGPTFTWCRAHWTEGRDVLAAMRPAGDGDHADDYQVHPGLLDTAFQALGAAIPGAGTGIDAHVPVAIGRLTLVARPQGPTWYLGTLKSVDTRSVVGDVRLVDESGSLVMHIEDVRLQRVPRDWLARLTAEPLPDWLHELTWVQQSLEVSQSEDAAADPGRWLILDGPAGSGDALAERLRSTGQLCEAVPTGVDPETRRDAVRKFLSAGEPDPRGLVFLCGPGIDAPDPGHAPDFDAARRDGWGGVLDILHAIVATGVAKPPRLWLVTYGAQPVGTASVPVALADAPLWGLGRVIASEHPELACTRIDVEPGAGPEQLDRLVDEFRMDGREDQVAFRGGERFVARLRRVRKDDGGLELPYNQPYRLEITSRGQLDDVALQPAARHQPEAGQVEIEVRATGLNFRDVLNVLDLYPGDPGPLGGECAGEVVAVGRGVDHVQVGDAVVALAPASFASHVRTLAEFVVPKPERLSFAEAATIPICFLTVHHALLELGRIGSGDRILIHAASGGVGMAAIQVARQAGAEIYATAGSERKRAYLRSLGIEHVLDSRSMDFADGVLEATAGEGVDLVLNSLTGETIGKSLSLLREGGRFLELGKTDLWDQRRVDEVKPGVAFHAIALDRMMADTPQTVGRLMREVVPQFADGRLTPPPMRCFAIQDTVAALRHMASAEHIGKLVIEAAEEGAGGGVVGLRDDGSYLITGGMGGLGLRVASWLAEHGAKCLVLVGRSGATETSRPALEALEASGVRVEVRRCDIADREQVAQMLDGIGADLPPLRGVFHLAGVLDDGILREQTRERFDSVMAAKVMGAWHLHDLTRDRPLDLFVLFSSAAALLGSPGQGNYAAANAFLDALAHHRRRESRHGLSVNWGSWSEVGMAARLKESEGQRWAAAGIGWIEPAQGLETLEQLIAGGRTQAGVLPIHWPKFVARIPPGSEPPWLTEIAAEARAAGTADGGSPVLLEKLQEVTPAECLEVALTSIRQQAARVLALEEEELPDPRRPLNELGFDSLTAVEFCNRVGRSIGQHINPTLLFDYPTLESLAGYVVQDLLALETGPEAGPPDDGEDVDDEIRRQAMDEVEGMSVEGMDALVTEQLERLQQ